MTSQRTNGLLRLQPRVRLLLASAQVTQVFGTHNMISDHHGRATDIATSLLTATDGIIGTHNPTAPFLFLLNVAFKCPTEA